MFRCLPNSAWSDWNLAEVAVQLGKMVAHPNQSQPNPCLRADESPSSLNVAMNSNRLLQTEEISDENKSIVWFLVKQVRPGMDLSRVVLPTFILEPRSFLDKLSDHYYHADLLSE